MSMAEINNNTTFDYPPSDIKVNRTINFQKNYNFSTITRRKSPIIYSTGVDDYVYNEIKKAKYQGCFDAGSLGNKNIFNDNRNFNTEGNMNIKSDMNNQNKAFEKNKKYSKYTTSHIHRHDEGKNLLIAKSEIQYPLKFYKSNYILGKKNNNKKRKNNSIEYIFYNSPVNIKKGYHNKNKNINLLLDNNYSYFTPIYNERNTKRDSELEKYENRKIINTLINSYNENSKIMNKIRNNKYNNTLNLKDKNILEYNRDNCFSPIVFSTRHSVYDSRNYNNKKDKKLTNNKNNNIKKDENNIKYSYYIKNGNDINNIQENEFYNEDDDNNDNDNSEKNNNYEIKSTLNKTKNKSTNNEVELINIYRKKILTVFMKRMSDFHTLYLRNVFNYLISQLKNIKKNGEYHFENKSIINISEIKKNLMSNSYYYGRDKQYKFLLKDIKNKKTKKNLKINNSNNNTNEFINRKKNIITDYNKDINKKEKINFKNRVFILKNNKINTENNDNKKENKKSIDLENNNNNNILNKKYVKKKVSEKIYAKHKQIIKINKKEILPKKVNYQNNNIDNNNDNNNNKEKRIVKSFDKTEPLNNYIKNKNKNNKINKGINKKKIISYNTSTIVKRSNEIKPKLFKKPIPISFNKNKIYNKVKNNENTKPENNNDIKNNLLQKSPLNKNIIKNIFQEYEEEEYNDEKINMSIKYLEMNNINSFENKNENKTNDFKIENAFTTTIIGNRNKDNEEIKTFSDKNLESAISIITKIMENKESEKKNKLKSLLSKIIQNKIQKEEIQNNELIKKYFNLLKNEDILKKLNKLSLDLSDNNILNKTGDLFRKKQLFNNDNDNDCESLPKTDRDGKEINLTENNEEKVKTNKIRGKFRVVIKKIKIHKSITKNIIDSEIKNIRPIKSSKNNFPLITDISDIPAINILKKTISLKINDNNSTLNNKDNKDNKDNDINININEIKKNLENKDDINIKKEQNENDDKKENNKDIFKKIEKEESSDRYKNLSLNIDNSNDKNNITTYSAKKFDINYKIVKNNNFMKNQRKSFRGIPRLRKSIESFTKYMKNKSKLNRSNKESIIEDDNIFLNEKYQDYENLIYYLRAQLIYCYLQNSKKDESYND